MDRQVEAALSKVARKLKQTDTLDRHTSHY